MQYKLYDMLQIAKIHGGECLSDELAPYQKLTFICGKDHVFKATAAEIYNGKWCPTCTGNYKEPNMKKLERINEYAHSRGGKCLSEHYSENTMLFECEKGHRFELNPVFAVRHTWDWCPECKKENFNKMTLKACQEYAEEHNGRLLSTEYAGTYKEPLVWECQNGHLFELTVEDKERYRKWCPLCSRYGDEAVGHIYEEMDNAAASRNGKLLSPKIEITSLTKKLTWECEKGHTFLMTPNMINKGKWCPECQKKRKYNVYTIKDMQKLAKKKGGKCLSTVYTRLMNPLEWQCDFGHTWTARPYSIIKGHWCPYCSGRKKAIKKKP